MLFYLLALLVISSQARTVSKVAEADVTAALNELVSLDVNGGGQDEVVVDFQDEASHKIFDHDNAPLPLFTSVSSRISSGPTIKAFENLLTTYSIPDVLEADPNTQARLDAIDAFLNLVLDTKVMQSAYSFLVKAGLSSSDPAAFKQQLMDLWFGTYARGTVEGSSGFESVFVGETHSGEVIGLSYWYRFYLLEQAEKVNYHGWFTREKGVQLELQFSWGEDKAMMDSFLLGTSPEFDMAASTICALANTESCVYLKDGLGIDLVVKTLSSGDKIRIDSVFPTNTGQTGPTKRPTTEGTKPTKKPPVTTKKPPAPSGKLQPLVDEMWAADKDKPTDYKLNWGKPYSGTKDTSPEPLITSENEEIFKRPQYQALIDMYDAEVFQPDVCKAEAAMTGFKKQYVNNVFDAFTNTTVFQLAYKYLQSIGVAGDWTSFRPKLWILWMGTYSRCKGPLGSSGFEHVFIGEWKASTVDGQHCWVQYYRLEKAGKINYHGYIHYDEQLTGTFQYTWEKYLKKIGGFNLGTSPAFDFSMFSICALTQTGSNACKFNIEGYPISVTSYTQQCAEGTCLSTAYPSD